MIRMPRARSALRTLLALALLSTAVVEARPTPPPTESATRADDTSEAEAFADGDRLAAEGRFVEALEAWREAYLRRLPRMRTREFRYPVEARFMTRDELGRFLVSLFEEEYPPEDMEADRIALSRLGFFPPDTDLRGLYTELMTEQIAGFYNPDTKRLYLIREEDAKPSSGSLWDLFRGGKRFDPQEQKSVLSHEMSHALADQHFDLYSTQRSLEDDDDATLAFSAVVEGEAMLVMMLDTVGPEEGFDEALLTLSRSVTSPLMRGLNAMAMGAAEGSLAKAPLIVREALLFPYRDGLVFCGHLATNGQWSGIDAALRAPPLSTEQILHPEKFTGEERDEPQALRLPDGDPLVEAGWRRVKQNCLGELGARVLLRSGVGKKAAEAAAAGWDGDVYRVWSSQGAAATAAVAWISTWDGSEDAAELVRTFLDARDLTEDGASPLLGSALSGTIRIWADEGRVGGDEGAESVTVIREDGSDVHIFEGVPRALVEPLLRWSARVERSPKRIEIRKHESRVRFGEPRRVRI